MFEDVTRYKEGMERLGSCWNTEGGAGRGRCFDGGGKSGNRHKETERGHRDGTQDRLCGIVRVLPPEFSSMHSCSAGSSPGGLDRAVR